MNNLFSKIKDKIISEKNRLIAENKQNEEAQKERIARLRELEEQKNGHSIVNPIKAIKTRNEIKNLNKEIEQYKEKKLKKWLVIGIILFFCFIFFMALVTDESSTTAEPTGSVSVLESESNTLVEEPATEPEPIVEEHVHAFSDATCTSPKTCECGATEGEALGHSWSSATCTVPQTCSICGETTGSTIAHAYSYGSCEHCGADDPNYVYEETVWVSNSGSRYHCRASCSGMKNPQEVSISTAKARGLTPCGRCY